MQRDLTAEYVAELVAAAPGLESEQLHKLRVLLNPVTNSKTRQRANASGSESASLTEFDDAPQIKERRRREGRSMSMMPPVRLPARSGGAAA